MKFQGLKGASTQLFFLQTHNAVLKMLASKLLFRGFFSRISRVSSYQKQVADFWVSLSRSVWPIQGSASQYSYHHDIAEFAKCIVKFSELSIPKNVIRPILDAYFEDLRMLSKKQYQSNMAELYVREVAEACGYEHMLALFKLGLMSGEVLDVFVRLSPEELDVANGLFQYLNRYHMLPNHGEKRSDHSLKTSDQLHQLLLNLMFLNNASENTDDIPSALGIFVELLQRDFFTAKRLQEFATPQYLSVNRWFSQHLHATFSLLSHCALHRRLLDWIWQGRFFIDERCVSYAKSQDISSDYFYFKFRAYVKFMLEVIRGHVYFYRNLQGNYDEENPVFISNWFQSITIDIPDFFDEAFTKLDFSQFKGYADHVASLIMCDQASVEVLRFFRRAVETSQHFVDQIFVDDNKAFINAREALIILSKNDGNLALYSNKDTYGFIIDSLIAFFKIYSAFFHYSPGQNRESYNSYINMIFRFNHSEQLSTALRRLADTTFIKKRMFYEINRSQKAQWLKLAIDSMLESNTPLNIMDLIDCLIVGFSEQNIKKISIENDDEIKSALNRYLFSVGDHSSDTVRCLEWLGCRVMNLFFELFRTLLLCDHSVAIAKKIIHYLEDVYKGDLKQFKDLKKFLLSKVPLNSEDGTIIEFISKNKNCPVFFDTACRLEHFYYSLDFPEFKVIPAEINQFICQRISGKRQHIISLIDGMSSSDLLCLDLKSQNPEHNDILLREYLHQNAHVWVKVLTSYVEAWIASEQDKFVFFDFNQLKLRYVLYQGGNIKQASEIKSISVNLADSLYHDEGFTASLINALHEVDTPLSWFCAGLINEKRFVVSEEESQSSILPDAGQLLEGDEHPSVADEHQATDCSELSDAESIDPVFIPTHDDLQSARVCYQTARSLLGKNPNHPLYPYVAFADTNTTLLIPGRSLDEDEAYSMPFSDVTIRWLAEKNDWALKQKLGKTLGVRSTLTLFGNHEGCIPVDAYCNAQEMINNNSASRLHLF